MAPTAENRRAYAILAVTKSQGKLPKPPPGLKLNRTPGFPLEDLGALFGHILNTLGPDLVALPPTASTEELSGGSKRARSPTSDEGGSNKRGPGAGGKKPGPGKGENGDETGVAVGKRSPMEVDAKGGGGAGEELDKVKGNSESGSVAERKKTEPQPDPVDHVQEGLVTARKSFYRVMGVWEGAAMEGKRGLEQRVVARLGRMLAEAEAEAAARLGTKAAESEVMTKPCIHSSLCRRVRPAIYLFPSRCGTNGES